MTSSPAERTESELETGASAAAEAYTRADLRRGEAHKGQQILRTICGTPRLAAVSAGVNVWRCGFSGTSHEGALDARADLAGSDLCLVAVTLGKMPTGKPENTLLNCTNSQRIWRWRGI